MFSLEKAERKEKDRRGKEVNVIRNNLIVQYVGSGSKKVGRIVAESFIMPNKLYFITLSAVDDMQFTEIRLTVNGKIEGSQSSYESMIIAPKITKIGSEVASSPFKGLLSDLMIICIPFDLEEQRQFYENYWDHPNGQRGKELLDDQLIKAKINEKYTISGCPKDLLRSYKYDENYKRSIQERRHFKEHVETEEEIKAKTDKSKAAKLERERIQKRIKSDVNTFVEDIRNGFPHYYECLISYVNSRKWIFKSWNLYSPTIKKPSEPVLPFPCVHNELSKLQDLQCPFYGIEEEYFFRVLNMLSEVNTEFKRILMKFAEITETIYKDKKFGIYIAYDRWLHYLCWAEELKPYGWVEKVEEDEEEEEEEDMSSSEEDPNELENKNPQTDVPQTSFTGNIFVGNKDGLKESLKGFMHELNETAEEETGDIPKMYYENRKLHSFEVTHDHERIQAVTFNYIVRTDEKTPWEEVMHEYEAHASEHNADEPAKDDKKDAKKDEKKSKNQPATTLYKMEQVKCFQEKLPEEDTGKKGQDEKKDDKADDLNAKKRYKFPDAKLMSKDVIKVLECEKIEFKTMDNKIYSIRGFYKDGRAQRLEFPKHMSPEFQKKREKRLQQIEDAKKAQEKQEEEIKAKEKEKKEREQRERRERRENKKNKEEFVKGPEVEEAPEVPPAKIDIPDIGEFGTIRLNWCPGKETKFAMALVSEDNDLIGKTKLS